MAILGAGGDAAAPGGDRSTLLRAWIVLVIVKQDLVQIGRIDGPTEYLSEILAAIKFQRASLRPRAGCCERRKQVKMLRQVTIPTPLQATLALRAHNLATLAR